MKQCRRNHDLPTKVHELIEAQARERPAHPNSHKDQHISLGKKPDQAGYRQKPEKRRTFPAAEKQGGCHRRNYEHVGILGQEKQGKTHSTVLGMKAGHQLGLCLRDVKGRPVCFRQSANKVEESGHRHPKDVPDLGL